MTAGCDHKERCARAHPITACFWPMPEAAVSFCTTAADHGIPSPRRRAEDRCFRREQYETAIIVHIFVDDDDTLDGTVGVGGR